jgi:hypothetical protein
MAKDQAAAPLTHQRVLKWVGNRPQSFTRAFIYPLHDLVMEGIEAALPPTRVSVVGKFKGGQKTVKAQAGGPELSPAGKNGSPKKPKEPGFQPPDGSRCREKWESQKTKRTRIPASGRQSRKIRG